MLQKDLQYYKSLEYNVIIKKEELDSEVWYVAYCNELGLNACHGIGEDKASALDSFVEEKEAFIEMLYEKGEPIPEVVNKEQILSGIFSVRTSPWIHSSLVQQAKLSGISLNSYVNQLLAYGVGQREASLKCEKKIDEMDAKIVAQNDVILKNLNSISYKTNSLFASATQLRFSDSTQYKSVV